MTATTPYDELPYPSEPFVATTPDRLATVGAVFEIPTVDPTNCRILELGCASGGNLVPHAMAYPGVECLGVDLSARQIGMGQARIDRLGVKNARLEVADLGTWRPEAGAWDYVICHGVYSWVPDHVRTGILEICRHALAPNGVACVSYNAHPGWRVQGVIRDAMVYLSSDETDPRRRAARARHVLEVLARNLGSKPTPYMHMMMQVHQLLEGLTDSYIAHEYLEAHNEPCYLHDFVRRAMDADLRYLGDAHLSSMLPQMLDETMQKSLMKLAPDVVSVEQYMDFLWARPFRTSLVIRDDTPFGRDLNKLDPWGFFVASMAEPVEREGDPGAHYWVVAGPDWAPRTKDPRIDALMARAAAAWPQAVPFEELADHVSQTVDGVPLPALDSDARHALGQHLAQWLLYAYCCGALELHRHGYTAAVRPGERPEAWAWSRDMALRSRNVTNLRHLGVALDPAEIFVLARADGTRTRGQIAIELAEGETRRRAILGEPGSTSDFDGMVGRILDSLADRALVVA